MNSYDSGFEGGNPDIAVRQSKTHHMKDGDQLPIAVNSSCHPMKKELDVSLVRGPDGASKVTTWGVEISHATSKVSDTTIGVSHATSEVI